MNFQADAFISYAHLDNVELIEGRRGWVSNLHRALEIRVGQLLGKPPHIWRDPKLQGNDFFGDTLVERLRRVAALVPVVSPRYVKSEWARKELAEFCAAAAAQGGVRLQDKARIFKVLKTPVPLEKYPPELQSLLGYEFFKVDPDTGRVYELDEVFGPEAQRDFWLRLDDLAHDICCLLEMLEGSEKTNPPAAKDESGAIFLGETTFDLREQRETIKRGLQQHGYTVLPDRSLSCVASEVQAEVREALSRCRMSIHLVGKNYSLVPEGGMASLLEIQNELAIEREQQGGFSRLLWISAGLPVGDERQRKFIERLRSDPRIQQGTDLLENSLADLETVIYDKLQGGQTSEQEPLVPATADELLRLYLIYDQRDAGLISPWSDFLFAQRFEVVRPLFEGDEAEIREDHEENLRTCDAALIFYGAGNECWLRRKLRELKKSAGYGRVTPMALVSIVLLPPRTPDKDGFRTHEALTIPQFEGFSPPSLQPLISRLRGPREG